MDHSPQEQLLQRDSLDKPDIPDSPLSGFTEFSFTSSNESGTPTSNSETKLATGLCEDDSEKLTEAQLPHTTASPSSSDTQQSASTGRVHRKYTRTYRIDSLDSAGSEDVESTDGKQAVFEEPLSAEEQEILHQLERGCYMFEKQGRYMAVLGCLERRLELLLSSAGQGHPLTLQSSRQLIEVYNFLAMSMLTSDPAKALKLLRRAEMVSSLPPQRDLQALTFNNLACYFRRGNKRRRALLYLERTLTLEVELEAKDNKSPLVCSSTSTSPVVIPPTVHTRVNLCTVLSEMQRYADALQQVQLAVRDIHHSLFGRAISHNSFVEELKDLQVDRKHIQDNTAAVIAAVYHNIGVQYECLRQHSVSLSFYSIAANSAIVLLGRLHPVAKSLAQSFLDARRAHKNLSSRQRQRRVLRSSKSVPVFRRQKSPPVPVVSRSEWKEALRTSTGAGPCSGVSNNANQSNAFQTGYDPGHSLLCALSRAAQMGLQWPSGADSNHTPSSVSDMTAPTRRVRRPRSAPRRRSSLSRNRRKRQTARLRTDRPQIAHFIDSPTHGRSKVRKAHRRAASSSSNLVSRRKQQPNSRPRRKLQRKRSSKSARTLAVYLKHDHERLSTRKSARRASSSRAKHATTSRKRPASAPGTRTVVLTTRLEEPALAPAHTSATSKQLVDHNSSQTFVSADVNGLDIASARIPQRTLRVTVPTLREEIDSPRTKNTDKMSRAHPTPLTSVAGVDEKVETAAGFNQGHSLDLSPELAFDVTGLSPHTPDAIFAFSGAKRAAHKQRSASFAHRGFKRTASIDIP